MSNCEKNRFLEFQIAFIKAQSTIPGTVIGNCLHFLCYYITLSSMKNRVLSYLLSGEEWNFHFRQTAMCGSR